jgi:hypothetical protein
MLEELPHLPDYLLKIFQMLNQLNRTYYLPQMHISRRQETNTGIPLNLSFHPLIV